MITNNQVGMLEKIEKHEGDLWTHIYIYIIGIPE